MQRTAVFLALWMCVAAQAESPDFRRGWDAYVQRDYVTALRYLVMAADGGDPRAAEALAEIHERGLGTPRDPEQAFRWRRKAEELRGAGRDVDEAEYWRERALEAEKRQWQQREDARRQHDERRRRQSHPPAVHSQLYWGYGIGGGPGFCGPYWDPRWGPGYYGWGPYRPGPHVTFGFSQWYAW